MNKKWNVYSLLSQRRVQAVMFVIFALGIFVINNSSPVEPASNRVIHVQGTSNPGGDGRSWATAYNSLDDALSVAVEGDEIWLTRGTYNLSSSETISVSKNIKVLGGFSGFETVAEQRDPAAYRSVLTAGEADSVRLEGDSSAVLDGVYVMDGVDTGGLAVVLASATYNVTVRYLGAASAPSVVVRTNTSDEVSSFSIATTIAGADIDGKYFVLQERGHAVYVWLEVNNDRDLTFYTAATAGLDATARTILINRFTPVDTAATIAARIAEVLEDEPTFGVVSADNTFVVTNLDSGVINGASHATAGTTGFSLDVANAVSTTDSSLTFTAEAASFTFDTASGSSFSLENQSLSLGGTSFMSWSDGNRKPLSTKATLTLSVEADTTIYMTYGNVIYVDVAASGANTGASWTHAFTTMAEALAVEKAANNPNDEVWVAKGRYNVLVHGKESRPGEPNSSTISLHEGLRLYGGFGATEANKEDRAIITENGRNRFANETILDGQGDCWHVVTGSDDAVIDGFVITNGNANGPASLTDARGGGMFNYAASPTVRNCVFYANRAEAYGGAFYCFLGSPKVENCIFGQKKVLPLNGLRAQPVYPALTPHIFDGTGELYTINGENPRRLFDGDISDPIVEIPMTSSGAQITWNCLGDNIRLIEVGMIATQKDDAIYEVFYFNNDPEVKAFELAGSFVLDKVGELCSTKFEVPRTATSREWYITRARKSAATDNAIISEIVMYSEQPEFEITVKDPGYPEDPEVFKVHKSDEPLEVWGNPRPYNIWTRDCSNYLKDNDETTPVFSTNNLAAVGTLSADFGQPTELTYFGFVAATNQVDNNIFSVTADGALVGTFRFDTPGGFNGLTFASPRIARRWNITQTTLTFKSAPISEIVYNKRQPVTTFGLLNSDPYLLRDGLTDTIGFTSRDVEIGDTDDSNDDPHVLIDIRNYEGLQPAEIVGVSMRADAADNVEWTVEYFDYGSLEWIELGSFTVDAADQSLGASWPPSSAQRLYRIRQTSFTGITANYTDLKLFHSSTAGNSAKLGGGAVFIENKSGPQFTNCDFQGNFCGQQVQEGEDAPDHTASSGGAVSNVGSYPTFDGCDFDTNYIWGYGDGGAMYNEGSTSGSTAVPVVANCKFRRNRASMYVHGSEDGIVGLYNGYGGAIFNSNSSPQITNCVFGGTNKHDGNTSTRSGGAIYNDDGSQPSISQCDFRGNQAIISGGAVFNKGAGAAASISNCNFYNNRAANGGAAYNMGTATVYTTCKFSGNVTYDAQLLNYTDSGFTPGLSIYSGVVYEENLDYLANFIKTTKFNGFARFSDYFAGMVSGTYQDVADPISTNKSMLPPIPDPAPIGGAVFPEIIGYYGAKGGAVYNENASTLFSECVFENNPLTNDQAPDRHELRVAPREGGAIYCGGADVSIDPASAETPSSGGIVTLANCQFYGNVASGSGGAVYAGAGYTLNISGCDFGKKDDLTASNSAGPRGDYEVYSSDALPIDGRGGALYAIDANVIIKESKFYNNEAGPIVEDLQAQAVYPGVGEGGAIYASQGTLTISNNSYFYRNNTHNDDVATSTSGGGIAYLGTTVDIDRIEFDENYCLNNYNADDGTASAYGGAIYGENGSLDLNGCTFRDNKVNMNVTFGIATKVDGNINPRIQSKLDLGFFDYVGNEKVVKLLGTGKIDARGGAVYASTNCIINECTFNWNIASEGAAANAGDDGQSSPSDGEGGAVYVGNGTVQSSTFLGNVSSDRGGALHIGGGRVVGSSFTRNWTGWRGSAISAGGSTTMTGCTLRENAAGGIQTRNLFSNLAIDPIWPASHPYELSGCGAVWGGRVENCLIESNIACSDFDPEKWSPVVWGGFGAGAGNATLFETQVRGNVAGTSAALYDVDTTSCLISSNIAVTGRGGVSTTGDLHINSIFISNTAVGDGGAFSMSTGTPLQLFNCTLTRNYTPLQGGGLAIDGDGLLAEITNTIIWGNTAGEAPNEFDALNEMVTDNGDVKITYSCIRGQETGGIISGTGNIGGQLEDDPSFLDAQANNLRLQPSSPCINAGTDISSLYAAAAQDYDGQSRDLSPDMGAHEFKADGPEIVIEGNHTELVDGTTVVQTADNTAWVEHTPASVNGVVQAPVPTTGATTIVLESTASDEDQYYKGDYLRLVGGPGAGYISLISSYDGETRTATLETAFGEDLGAATTYRIYRPHTFTVRNIGIRDLLLTGDLLTLTGSHTNDFMIISQPLAQLGSGASTTFTIAYGPTAGVEQYRNATVTVYSNDTDESVYSFAIQGEAGTGKPELKVTGLQDNEIANNDLSPDAIDGTAFGSLDYRAGARVVSFNIFNIGGADLVLEDLTPTATAPTYIELTGDTSDFSITVQPNSSTIRPSQAVGFEVTFNPVAVGNRSATLTFRNNDPSKGVFRFDINGAGIGPRIEINGNNQSLVNVEDLKDESGIIVEPLGINTPLLVNHTDFGSLTSSKSTLTRYFVIKNSGTQLLNLTSAPSIRIWEADSNWQLTEPETDSADFVLAQAPGSNIPPQFDTSFSIEYRPSSSGDHYAIIQIANDDRRFTFRVKGTAALTSQLPPVAIGSINGQSGNVVEVDVSVPVSLSASGSYDQDGTLQGIEWSGTGTAFDFGTSSSVNYQYYSIAPAGGKYDVTLVVTDNDGLTDSKDFTVLVGKVLKVELPTTLRESSGLVIGAGKVSLANGYKAESDLTITLLATVGGSLVDVSNITMYKGLSSVYFNLTVGNDTAVGNTPVTIQASTSGFVANSADMTIIDNDSPTIVVSGKGNPIADGDTTPHIADSTEFSPIYDDTTSGEAIFTIQNAGGGNLELTDVSTTATPEYVSISGADAANFTVILQPAQTIVGGASSQFRIKFTPGDNVVSERFATVTIGSNAVSPADSYTFDIMGTRGANPEIQLSYGTHNIASGDDTPSSTDGTLFSDTAIGNTLNHTFVITNYGDAPLGLSGSPKVRFTGENHTDFVLTTPPASATIGSVSSGSNSVPFVVGFNPRALGTRTAILVIDNTDPDEDPYTFTLSGQGAPPANLELYGPSGEHVANGSSPLVANGTDYGTVEVGVATGRSFTIKNIGSSGTTVTLTDMDAPNGTYVQVTGSAYFTISQQPAGDTVTSSLSQSFSITYLPLAEGLHSATVRVESDDVLEPVYEFQIQGNAASGIANMDVLGLDVVIADGSTAASASNGTDYGQVASGSTAIKTFTITNSGPNSTLRLTGNPYVTVTGGSGFSITSQPADGILTEGESTTFTVTFAPGASDVSYSGTISILHDSSDSEYTFVIAGNSIVDTTEDPVVIVDTSAGSSGGCSLSGADKPDWGVSLLMAMIAVVMIRRFLIKRTKLKEKYKMVDSTAQSGMWRQMLKCIGYAVVMIGIALPLHAEELQTVTGKVSVNTSKTGSNKRSVGIVYTAATGKSAFTLLTWDTADALLHASMSKLSNGMTVTVEGKAVKRWKFEVKQLLSTVRAAASPAFAASSAAASPAFAASSPVKTLAIVVSYYDAEVEATNSELHGALFSDGYSMNEWYKEVSRNKVSFEGIVVGPYRLPYSKRTVRDLFAQYDDDDETWKGVLAEEAKLLAEEDGHTLTDYDQFIVYFPDTDNVSWGGLSGAAIGLISTRASTAIHEMLHTQEGLGHAAGPVYPVDPVPAPLTAGNCHEYGDKAAMMGKGIGYVNAPHASDLGWLPQGCVETVEGDGVYRIESLAKWSSNPKIITISHANAAGLVGPYIISFRAKHRWDEFTNQDWLNRVYLHSSMTTVMTEDLEWNAGNLIWERMLEGDTYTGERTIDGEVRNIAEITVLEVGEDYALIDVDARGLNGNRPPVVREMHEIMLREKSSHRLVLQGDDEDGDDITYELTSGLTGVGYLSDIAPIMIYSVPDGEAFPTEAYEVSFGYRARDRWDSGIVRSKVNICVIDRDDPVVIQKTVGEDTADPAFGEELRKLDYKILNSLEVEEIASIDGPRIKNVKSVRGYFVPQETGLYSFRVVAPDPDELAEITFKLSHDGIDFTPNDITDTNDPDYRIITDPNDPGYHPTKFPLNISPDLMHDPIISHDVNKYRETDQVTLTAGKWYYFEVEGEGQKDGKYDWKYAVSWIRPERNDPESIPGDFLRPFIDDNPNDTWERVYDGATVHSSNGDLTNSYPSATVPPTVAKEYTADGSGIVSVELAAGEDYDGEIISRTWEVLNASGAVLFTEVHDLTTDPPPAGLPYSFTYDYPVGSYQIRLTVEDSEHEIVIDTFGIIVHANNNFTPIAKDATSSFGYQVGSIGGRIALTMVATDGDNDILTYTVVTVPGGGILWDAPTGGTQLLAGSSLPAGINTVYFQPTGSAGSVESFTFQANDGTVDSNIATFTLDIINGGTLTISPLAGVITEAGGSATFTVRLSKPTDFNVIVPIVSSDVTEATVSPSSLIFSDRTWNFPQTVTVRGVNDLVDDDNQPVTISIGQTVSNAPAYRQLPISTLNATVYDDDTADILVSQSAVATSESGSTATFDVSLVTQPTATVIVRITSGDTTEGLVSKSGSPIPAASVDLTFNTSNWLTPQTVTVTGQDDALEDGDISYNITVSADPENSTTDTKYDRDAGIVSDKSVAVTNSDDDIYVPVISDASGDTDENGKQATFTVVLSQAPTAEVAVTVTVDDTTEALLTAESSPVPAGSISLSFVPADWNVAQTVTVTGQDDFILDGTIGYTIQVGPTTSSDANYNKTQADPNDASVPWPSLQLTNADNDTAGLVVSAVSGDTDEDGLTATFTVRLSSMPSEDVTVAVASDDTGEVTVAPATLTFTSATWNDVKTVTATGVDDDIPDGSRTVSVSLDPASDDSAYNVLDTVIVSVINLDNDEPGIPGLVVSADTLTVREGTNESILVSLNQEPQNTVTVSASLSGDADLTIEGNSTLTFTVFNWNIPRGVQISAAQDDDDVNGTATLLIDANDPAITDASVAVVEDDDELTDPPVEDVVDETAGGDSDSGCQIGTAPSSGNLSLILALMLCLLSIRLVSKRVC